MAREDRRGHRLEKAHAAHRAVSAAAAPAAARFGADLEALEAHREAPLEHLGIGEARIGHVRLHYVGAVELRSGARAAGYGLVVLVALVPEREIVHGALRSREHTERAIERVGDALRGLYVSGNHGRGVARPQHGALGNRNAERLEAARVERDVVVDQRAEYVQHRRHAHRRRRVEIVWQLRRGTGEVDSRFSSVLQNLYGNPDARAVIEGIVELAVL